MFLYQLYEYCPNRQIRLVDMATKKAKFTKKNKNLLLRSHRRMKLKLCRNVHNISLHINCVFVAVAQVLFYYGNLKFPLTHNGKSVSVPLFLPYYR